MRKWISVVVVATLVMAMTVPAVAIATPGKGKGKSVSAVRDKGKPTLISHPYTKKTKVSANKDFMAWGHINTWHRVPLTSEATVTIKVQKWADGRSWETSAGLMTTATVAATGKFKKKTNYAATLNIPEKGRYRIAAVLVWKDAKGVEHMKRSSWKYIRIK